MAEESTYTVNTGFNRSFNPLNQNKASKRIPKIKTTSNVVVSQEWSEPMKETGAKKKCLRNITEKSPVNSTAESEPLNQYEGQKILKQAKVSPSTNSSQDWMESFKNFLEEQKTKETQRLPSTRKRLNTKTGARDTKEENQDNKNKQRKNKQSKSRKGKSGQETTVDTTLALGDLDNYYISSEDIELESIIELS